MYIGTYVVGMYIGTYAFHMYVFYVCLQYVEARSDYMSACGQPENNYINTALLKIKNKIIEIACLDVCIDIQNSRVLTKWRDFR